MFLRSKMPYFSIRRSLSPTRTKFFANILTIMYELEGQSDQGFENYSSAKTITLAQSHYERMILAPCRYYIDIMHTAMDPITFHGRIIDLSRSKFPSAQVPDEVRTGFYKLVQLYAAREVIDNQEYKLDWTKAVSYLYKSG